MQEQVRGPRGFSLASLWFICFFTNPWDLCSPQECGRISNRPEPQGAQQQMVAGRNSEVIFFFHNARVKKKEASDGAPLSFPPLSLPLHHHPSPCCPSPTIIWAGSRSRLEFHHIRNPDFQKIAVQSVVAGSETSSTAAFRERCEATGNPSGRNINGVLLRCSSQKEMQNISFATRTEN